MKTVQRFFLSFRFVLIKRQSYKNRIKKKQKWIINDGGSTCTYIRVIRYWYVYCGKRYGHLWKGHEKFKLKFRMAYYVFVDSLSK